VRIGSVESITLEPQRLDAVVVLAIDKRFDQLPEDSSAAVFTSGLLGDQYIAIRPGGSPESLRNGDEIILTQSAISLEDLIGKFVTNGPPAPKNDKPASGG
jgi:phospholipid/cholesterol/gamma-HCH transport system substrate-binding protein